MHFCTNCWLRHTLEQLISENLVGHPGSRTGTMLCKVKGQEFTSTCRALIAKPITGLNMILKSKLHFTSTQRNKTNNRSDTSPAAAST